VQNVDLTNTDLHSACYFGKLEMAREALYRGARSNAENIRGETPLHLVSRGQYESQGGGVGIVQLLIGHGANVDARDKGRMTPLHSACYYGKLQIVRALLSHGASVNMMGVLGQTALHLVLEGNRSGPDGVRIVRLLLEHGADVDAKDSDKETPLHLACNYGDFAIGRVLLIHGANPNAENIDGRSPLHMLSLWPYIEDESRLVGILVDGGADVNARDNDHETPLHTAYRNNRLDIVERLLKKSADKGAKNNKGETPIQLAPQPMATG
jgi:ankyrin repeat protein